MYTSTLRNLCKSLLETGREKLFMSMGIVSHIDGDQYIIVAVSSETEVFVADESFPLKETYCRDVYEQRKTIALTELDGVPGLQRHPLYLALTLEAYISAPIIVGNKVWGTINFSSMKIREHAFTNEDINFIETAAKLISTEISSES